ncbi:MAG: signal peptidase I [Clostridia bacterium]|nr:signal peptidase I [Clostridia bacterium]
MDNQNENFDIESQNDIVSKEKKDCDGILFPEFISGEKSENPNGFGMVLDGLDVIVSAMIAVVILFSFVFRVPTIDGSSMNDTLFDGERVIISDLMYEPEYGDIVVISRNYTNDSGNVERYSMPIIKRVIATEGQTVDIDFEKGKVYVDGKELNESYTKTPTNLSYDIEFPVTVKKNCIFVLGDNRNDSLDSRSSQIGSGGMIDKRYILGKAYLRIFPFDRIGKIGSENDIKKQK